ncbi:MAG: Mur ligase family protein [Erysipelotrichales bacterium]|nr:Mur ligase family protein [Erysipelotrichales bacterium]
MKKLSEIKSELQKKYEAQITKNNFVKGRTSLDNVKIIGTTGSRGKSTVTYLVHEYLKFKGKKSILYSSLGVDSPASFKGFAPVEVPLYNEKTIFNIINEAEAYGTDYLVLEVNETAIDKGLADDLPFNVRALTGIIPGHSLFYDHNYYINLKKRFMRVNDSSKLVFGLTRGTTKEMMEELLNISSNEKILFGLNYVINVRGFDSEMFDFVLTKEKNNGLSLEGLEMEINTKSERFALQSKLIMPFHLENILCVLGILKACDELDIDVFKDFLLNITVPGREEVFKYKKRTIILSIDLLPQLEELKKMHHNKLLVVAGAEGVDFKGFIKDFPEEIYYQEKTKAIKAAGAYMSKYADHVYLTSNSNANFEAHDFLKYQAEALKGASHEIIISREEAIKKAIADANEGDIIFISGRGNREKFLTSFTEMEIIKDLDLIEKSIYQEGDN